MRSLLWGDVWKSQRRNETSCVRLQTTWRPRYCMCLCRVPWATYEMILSDQISPNQISSVGVHSDGWSLVMNSHQWKHINTNSLVIGSWSANLCHMTTADEWMALLLRHWQIMVCVCVCAQVTAVVSELSDERFRGEAMSQALDSERTERLRLAKENKELQVRPTNHPVYLSLFLYF